MGKKKWRQNVLLLVTGIRSLYNEEETGQNSASSAMEPQPVIRQ